VKAVNTVAFHRALLLQDSEFCNEGLPDANPRAVWLFDADFRRILAANKAAAALYGVAQYPLAILSVEALFPDGEGATLSGSLPAATLLVGDPESRRVAGHELR